MEDALADPKRFKGLLDLAAERGIDVGTPAGVDELGRVLNQILGQQTSRAVANASGTIDSTASAIGAAIGAIGDAVSEPLLSAGEWAFSSYNQSREHGILRGGAALGLAADFAMGFAHSAYSSVVSIPGALTNFGRTLDGIAGSIDRLIAAEDTPAYRQINTGWNALRNSSPRDLALGAGGWTATIGGVVLPSAGMAGRLRFASVPNRGIEMAVRARGLAAETNVWKLGAGPRGEAIEQALGHNLPGNFPVIDRFENGLATSIKSIDLDGASYLTGNILKSTLTRYVDKVARFNGARWAGKTIRQNEISGRALDVVVPHGGTAAQQAILNQIIKYGSTNGVTVNVIHYP